MQKLKVLLIDDNPMIRVYIRDVLWVHGLAKQIDLTTVDNIQQAEEIIQKKNTRPDAVLLDLSLPFKMGEPPNTQGGFALLTKIRKDPESKNIKVIIFSGFSDLAFRREAAEMGADAYLIKDENLPQDLVKAIKKYLNVP